MAAGRPTDYLPEYCDQLIEHMATGLSFASFGGVIGVAESTLHLWKKSHLEFSESEAIGRSRSMLFWEAMGIVGTTEGNHFNAMSWKFNMGNRFNWREKSDLTSDDEPLKIVDIGSLLAKVYGQSATDSIDEVSSDS